MIALPLAPKKSARGRGRSRGRGRGRSRANLAQGAIREIRRAWQLWSSAEADPTLSAKAVRVLSVNAAVPEPAPAPVASVTQDREREPERERLWPTARPADATAPRPLGRRGDQAWTRAFACGSAMKCAAILELCRTPAVIDDAMNRRGIEGPDRVVSMQTRP